MGRRTHATVLHSVTYIRNLMEEDAALRQQIARIQADLQH
jgi:chromosomal replication initiation ATPase DnaA